MLFLSMIMLTIMLYFSDKNLPKNIMDKIQKVQETNKKVMQKLILDSSSYNCGDISCSLSCQYGYVLHILANPKNIITQFNFT